MRHAVILALLVCLARSASSSTLISTFSVNLTTSDVHFTTTNDSTPVLIAVSTSIAGFGSTKKLLVTWYNFNDAHRFDVLKQYEVNSTLRCGSADGSSFLLDPARSPNRHPILVIGCSLRSPISLDLWTLQVVVFESATLRQSEIYYNPATPQLIWSTSSSLHYLHGWNISSGQLIERAPIAYDTARSRILFYKGSVLINDGYYSHARIRQWDQDHFVERNITAVPKFNTSVPNGQILTWAQQGDTSLYAFGRQYPAFSTCTGAHKLSVSPSAPPKFDVSLPCLNDSRINSALPHRAIVLPKAIVLLTDLPYKIATFGFDLAIQDVLPISLPGATGSIYHDQLVAVPSSAEKQYPFSFLASFSVFLDSTTLGPTFFLIYK